MLTVLSFVISARMLRGRFKRQRGVIHVRTDIIANSMCRLLLFYRPQFLPSVTKPAPAIHSLLIVQLWYAHEFLAGLVRTSGDIPP
jgi:hypothetical protein